MCVEFLDRALSEDFDASGANLLLVVDQFEEVFRKEVVPEQRRRLMALIRYVFEFKPSGVFLALVMRSEDLHRCAEEPGLSDIVNSSSMFVDWLDQPQLRRAIIEPAQRVFNSWLGPCPTSEQPTAPFHEAVVDDLLDDADTLKGMLDHKSDHLPLLQHGLRVLWQRAVKEWGAAVQRAEANSRDITLDDLRIEPILISDAIEEARGRFTQTQISDASTRTGLQWLLAAEAEGTLERAEVEFAVQAGSRPVLRPRLGLQAAFCEMASLDENRRYYRAFRYAEEIVRN